MTDVDAWAATARDIHDITQVKYRYLRGLDTKDWELFATVFVPDVTGDYNGLKFTNADALVEYMRTNMPEGMLTLHQAHHPEITVDGDTAVGHWYLYDKVIVEAFKFVLEGAAFYTDHYVRTPDGWKLSHTGYVRTWQQQYSLEDLPSMKIDGPGVAFYADAD
jgi:hypothetical protein